MYETRIESFTTANMDHYGCLNRCGAYLTTARCTTSKWYSTSANNDIAFISDTNSPFVPIPPLVIFVNKKMSPSLHCQPTIIFTKHSDGCQLSECTYLSLAFDANSVLALVARAQNIAIHHPQSSCLSQKNMTDRNMIDRHSVQNRA